MPRNQVTKNAVAGDKMQLLDRVTPNDDLDTGAAIVDPNAPASITAKASARAKKIKDIITAKADAAFDPRTPSVDESEEPDDEEYDEYDDEDEYEEELEESFSFLQRFDPEMLNFKNKNLTEVFSTEEFSEELQEKLITIFEAALKDKALEILEDMDKYYQDALEEQVETISVVLSEKIDEKLDYISYQWLNENEIAVESSLKTELTTTFMSDLKDLFESHYIELPEEKYDVLSEMTDAIDTLEERLNEQVESNIQLSKLLKEYTIADTVDVIGTDLSELQKQKLYQLAEGIDFESSTELNRKVSIIKESTFPNNKKYTISEDYLPTSEDNYGIANKYAKFLK
jgi:hypothetical protein